MKKIGIVGAGQAGQRIAVALSTFEDVQITGIVDPINGKDILSAQNSAWFIQGATFFDNDDEMIAQGYDGLIIAADPINVAHSKLMMPAEMKMAMLSRNNVTCPILWERPLGFDSLHPQKALTMVPSDAQSVISWTRYGLPVKVVNSLLSSGSLGDIIDFEIFVTLNCGLRSKKWRQLGEMGISQPIHLLDNALEQIESMGLGLINKVSSRRQDATRYDISFDEKWEIFVTLDSGITGRIIGIQYVGQKEFLYALRSYKIIGTAGALISALGSTKFIDSDGRENPISMASYGIDPRIVKSTEKLEHFFRAVDGYPVNASCKNEAQSLSECLRTWIDSIGSHKKLSSFNLSTPNDVVRHLDLAKVILESTEVQPN